MLSGSTIGAVDSAIQAVGPLALRNRPLLAILAKYWWITLPAGAGLGLQLWSRYKRKDLTLFLGLQDAAVMATLVAATITISEIGAKNAAGLPLAVPAGTSGLGDVDRNTKFARPPAAAMTTTDADFTARRDRRPRQDPDAKQAEVVPHEQIPFASFLSGA